MNTTRVSRSSPSAFHHALRAFGRQRWILRGRERLIRSICPPESFESVPFEVPFFGDTYAGDLSDFIEWSVFFLGAYAPEELFLLEDVAAGLRAKGPVYFYDIGANVGQHSRFMASRCDHVFAVEPFPTARGKLGRQLAGLNATIFPFALGDEAGTADLFIPEGPNLGTATLSDNLPGNYSGQKVVVEVKRGDDAFDGMPPMSILKLDVQDFEAKVLAGLQRRLQSDRPVILTEIYGSSRSGFESEQMFRGLLYENAVLFRVLRGWGRYRLPEFSFDDHCEALVVPEELVGELGLEALPVGRG